MKKIINQKVGAISLVFSSVAILLSPVVASAATANTTVSVDVGSTLSLSSTGAVSFSITPTSGGVESSGSDTVTVSTNDTAGYTLKLADSDATTTLASGSDTFTASSNTYASPTTLATGEWGYAIPGGDFSGSYTTETNQASSSLKWAGVPGSSSPQTIKTTATTATNDTTTVWYAAAADSSQPTGTYTDTVTYTATAN